LLDSGEPRDPFGISVVIVNWNGRDDLAVCLAALEAQTDRDFETIVVDNGSNDGSTETVRRDFGWVRLVEAGENLGFAEGTNRGIELARGAWIATLNNDTLVDPGWIRALREAARTSGDRLGMLQSCVVFKKNPARTNSTGVLLFTNGVASDRDFGAPLRPDDPPDEVFCPTAGAALYRRAMLEETRLLSGVFDRSFFMYFEDVDLGWRCRLAGWSATYVPSAVVRHEFQASSKRQKGRFIGLHLRRNRVRMLLKNGTWWFVVRTLPRTIYELCETIVWLGPRVIPSLFRAVSDGLRQRGAVTRLLRVSRREVERAWLSPPQ
jgi:GT2 family glycosyltransferase